VVEGDEKEEWVGGRADGDRYSSGRLSGLGRVLWVMWMRAKSSEKLSMRERGGQQTR